MAAVINTNIASLNTQRNLGTSQSALNTSIQRLSSGLRINSAKDDAAGLAISERMNAQIRGLNVAARNANDGISLAQTAEGALGKVGDMLQRMRELAVQSANATNSTSDRNALQAEATQLKEEIGRVASTTKFNGTPLLDGTFTAQNFQVGANSGETITLASIANAQISALGSWTDVGTAAAASYTTATIAAFDFSGVGAYTTTGNFTAGNYTASLPGNDAHFDVTDDSGTYHIELAGTDYTGNEAGLVQAANSQLAAAGSNTTLSSGGAGTPLVLTSGEFGAASVAPTISFIGPDMVSAGMTTGTSTAGSGGSFGPAGFSVDGNVVNLTSNAGSLAGLVSAVDGQLGSNYLVSASGGGLKIESAVAGSAIPVAIGSFTGKGAAVFGTGATAVAGSDGGGVSQTGFSSLDISTALGAQNAILAMDAALSSVNSARGTLGAIQSRFESAVSNIQIQSENLSAARSRIVDADFASETAALTRGQILQQAGTAMLAQANSLPNNVLSLLR